MKRVGIILGMVLLPLVAQAEPLTIVREAPVQKKFLPLDRAQADAAQTPAGLALKPERKPFVLRSDVLRSDNSQLQSGFMRIDRGGLNAPIPPQHALPVPATAAEAPSQQASLTPANTPVPAVRVTMPDAHSGEAESEEIEGNNESYDPVLALFGGGGAATPSSFAEAMRNPGSAISIAGLVRHSVWPIALSVKQYVSSGYGMRTDPFHGRPAFHGGIDIVAPTGTPVLATADGQVAQVASDGNYGNYITLQHADGTLSRYGHLSAQNVRVGQQVRAGQPIGAVGATGRATGAHLDYRVSKNGMKFDPLAILNLPSNVAFNGIKPLAVAQAAPAPQSRIASKPLPRAPMLIKVQ